MNGKVCEVCLKNQAKYVCSRCGKIICEDCFNPYSWSCIKCEELQTSLITKQSSSFNPFKFIFLGFTLIFIGILIMFLAALLTGLSNSFIIFFGPIPFMLSFGKSNLQILVFIAFIIAIIAFILLMFKKAWF